MKPHALLAAILIVAPAAAFASKRPSLKDSAFQSARRKCGAVDAHRSKSDPDFIAFKGFAPDHGKQADCLVRLLRKKGGKLTGFMRVGYISEPPK